MVLQRQAIDLLSAALRHVRDAEFLLTAPEPSGSVDQAFHLAGYGPECARKATLTRRDFDQTIGHRFDPPIETIIDALVALDAWAQRYKASGWPTRFPALTQWQETVRYRRTGSTDPYLAREVVVQSREAVDGIVAALWADGRFPIGETPW
jgi:hypothetical protein